MAPTLTIQEVTEAEVQPLGPTSVPYLAEVVPLPVKVVYFN
jgi:hypothetical protein